jgi:hypothetical protein
VLPDGACWQVSQQGLREVHQYKVRSTPGVRLPVYLNRSVALGGACMERSHGICLG